MGAEERTAASGAAREDGGVWGGVGGNEKASGNGEEAEKGRAYLIMEEE